MRLMKDLSWSLAKPDLAMEVPNFQKPGTLAALIKPRNAPIRRASPLPVYIGRTGPLHIVQREIQDRSQAQRKSLCRRLAGNQILPYLNQHMRQPAQRAVLIQSVAL